MYDERDWMKTKSPNRPFHCPLKVRTTSARDFPPHLRCALVDCFVAAPDAIAALRIAVEDLSAQHFVFDEVRDNGVHQIDALEWDEYASLNQCAFKQLLPAQDEVVRFVEQERGIFYGPFCAAPDG
jgi:hypothetical protein